MDNMLTEIWKDLEGSEGAYRISNLGRLMSFKYGYPKILKTTKDKDGYLMYKPRINGKKYYFKAHRLVALYFIDNPNNYDQVNHKDGNKQNNEVSNLEWVTVQMNIIHAYKTGLHKGFKGNPTKMSKSVIQLDAEGNMINKFPSISHAEWITGVDGSTITYQANQMQKGKQIRGGAKWRYAI